MVLWQIDCWTLSNVSVFLNGWIDWQPYCVFCRASLYGQSRPTSYMPRTPTTADRVILNPCLPPHPDFLDTSTLAEKHRWRHSSPSSPPPISRVIPPRLDRKHRYSFRLSVQDLQVKSHLRSLCIDPQRLVLIFLPITFTIILSVLIVHARRYVKENIVQSTYTNSTRLFQFCALYDNNYYVNLVTLPIAVVILIIIICNQTGTKYCRERGKGKFSIYTPIPFNPFSKVNRFDTMALCGVVSHEILQIIEEIFLKATQMKLLTMRGPLFDLIRQIGLVIIIGMRYYPVYAVVEMPKANVLYYALCALYMWIDLTFRILEQSYCYNVGPMIKTWQKFQDFKNHLSSKLSTHHVFTTTMATLADHDDLRAGGGHKGTLQKIREHIPIKRFRSSSTTIASALQVKTSNILTRRLFSPLNSTSFCLSWFASPCRIQSSTGDETTFVLILASSSAWSNPRYIQLVIHLLELLESNRSKRLSINLRPVQHWFIDHRCSEIRSLLLVFNIHMFPFDVFVHHWPLRTTVVLRKGWKWFPEEIPQAYLSWTRAEFLAQTIDRISLRSSSVSKDESHFDRE